jgi:predicted outer membrane protein
MGAGPAETRLSATTLIHWASNPGAVPPVTAQDQQGPDPLVSDRQFVKNAIENSAADVELGKIAQQNGSSDTVKEFGKRMVQVHSQTREELKQAAAKANQPRKAKKVAVKLNKLSGADFDRAFARLVTNIRTSTRGIRFHPSAYHGSTAGPDAFAGQESCINYVLLCQGRVDVAIDPRMNPWDIAAVAPCLREAGGVLSSVDGNDDVVWQPNLVASANLTLHARVLDSLRPS